jgi:hypothetical protein
MKWIRRRIQQRGKVHLQKDHVDPTDRTVNQLGDRSENQGILIRRTASNDARRRSNSPKRPNFGRSL